ncbi:type II toxin-antitoxin system HipA family toxin [Cocleimonas sp. KMM 6892]|uniref:type II toxin-antitoxin system HipA family toxin n=1 Tax=unclassified Cocleimonas TaxID=2639732 RepID=UPI002DB7ED8F|nr:MULTISPECIES: type II toxin-antitoxin system HipA family toxin [unclassified Cocleimonas]MEB8433857.1 type II toxin-antitoxin system HipA family toxin [Cocleimonas sp. KMM 6892]MEC4716668.1 type II toxin-antitoxin system HipA family toxin [Cocleimonas sp. KMM 6895]MEC4746177.1 type II toxin-antitoxin system HipA family toxin [Cocleimonas sp. KMM 6896]
MVKKIDTAFVKLWGDVVGAVAWLDDREYAVFEYDKDFLKKGLDIAPITMSLNDARRGDGKFAFSALNKETYLGLPGMLADVLPDKFGNSIIDAWLARNGRDSASFSPVERLCYSGKRGMGALEFSPTVIEKYDDSVAVEIAELVKLAQDVMQERKALDVQLSKASDKENEDAILDILRVGTSAGGARPKAVIAMNDKGNVISGQTDVPKGYDYWLLKFDGVTDLELGEPKDYGRIEYAYYLMAKEAGIEMMPCKLLEENGRAHFMTKRFDRENQSGQQVKQHMQTLCGIAHYDFNSAGATSYEQAFEVMRKLRLSKAEATQQYRRMLFNIISRNQDDHTKNISFLMNQQGEWRLSPAYDVTYSHNPAGQWTNQHQMSVNGKRDHFTREELIETGKSISLSRPDEILEEVISAVGKWMDFAKEAGVSKKISLEIQKHQRMGI